MTKFSLASALAVAVLGLAVPALAAPAAAKPAAITVTGFNQTQLNAYDDKSNPLPAKIPASAFAVPLTTTASGPGGTIALTYQGKTVYVRRLDVKTQEAAVCAVVADNDTRPDGSMKAGERMGINEKDKNCLVGAK